jgi:tripartite-type tricarboxylate transporter receptor subunit TctC
VKPYCVSLFLHGLALSLSISPLVCSGADAYPSRPIHVVVPAPAGGGSDVNARVLGEALSRSMGQPIVVENRPGAGGNIAADLVAKAKPDGYTLLLGHTGISSISPWVYPNLSYDGEKKTYSPSHKLGPDMRFW